MAAFVIKSATAVCWIASSAGLNDQKGRVPKILAADLCDIPACEWPAETVRITDNEYRVSQSSVCQAVAHLEKQLGLVLIDRSTGRWR